MKYEHNFGNNLFGEGKFWKKTLFWRKISGAKNLGTNIFLGGVIWGTKFDEQIF